MKLESFAILKKTAEKLEKQMIAEFRNLHQKPELSGVEWGTAAWLKDQLRALGCAIVEIEGPGFYAVLESGHPGPSLAIRADMDALPLQEASETLCGARAVCSQVQGLMHACGHDAHMAILLTLARTCAENRDTWCGRLLFLLESGEETGVGIQPMLTVLQEEKIDAIFGLHVRSVLPAGTVGIRSGAIMAGTVMFSLRVQGRGGHSSRPDLACSPIFASAQILNAWGASWINQMDPTSPLTLGIGKIQGGEAANVIPDSVEMAGTIRYFAEGRGKQAFARLMETARQTATAFGTVVEGEVAHCNEPVWNDEDLVSDFVLEAKHQLGKGLDWEPEEIEPWFASETFSHYRKLAPTLFILLGINRAETGCGADHHNRLFCVEESVLLRGVEAGLVFIQSQMK